MADFIKAEVIAVNIATYGAQLAPAIVDAKHTERAGRGGVYFDRIRDDIASIRTSLAEIEAALDLTGARSRAAAAAPTAGGAPHDPHYDDEDDSWIHDSDMEAR